MAIILDGTAGIANNATDLSYTGTLTGSTGVVNIGSGQVYKDASGNVGIGTSSPTAKLAVTATNGYDGIQITTADVQYIKFLSAGGTKNWGFATTNLGASDFGIYQSTSNGGDPISAGTPRLYFDGSGKLLVGETAVDDSGGLAVIPGYATGAPAILAFNKGNSAGETCLRFKYQGSQVGAISYGSSSTTYATSSDYRLKNTIAPMTGALAKVALLKPCTYKWNVDGSDGQGFIAHELQEVVEGCVTGEKDAVDADGNPQYQGIDTSFLVATLTAAIQELKAIVDTQATRITALEGAAA
jgi:hypothetical protein